MANQDDFLYVEEMKICKIYDHDDFFTVAVQLVLAALALASLWIKRLQEVPRRLFWTWFMDVFKQGLGAGYAHVLNMVVAAVLSVNIRGDVALEDQCAWYGMSFLIDTTLGLFLAIVCLRILDYWAKKLDWGHLKNSGVYVGPDGWKHWLSQVFAWMVILTIVKIVMYLFMWVFSSPLAIIGQIIFAPFQGNIRVELLFVMILFPGLMNVIYFWIADSYLKAQGEQEGTHESKVAEMADSKQDSLLKEAIQNDTNQKQKPPSLSIL